MDIDKIRTTAYKPSTNGCVERFHRTLNSMIGKVIDSNHSDWDERLPSIMAVYRAARHESTGYSPNFVVLGRENRAPLDITLGDIPEEKEYYNSYDKFVSQMQQRWRKSYSTAREHLETAAERRKREYDVKVKSKQFSIGDWVYYFYPRRYTKKNPKWSRNYDGPFLVVNVIPPSDYVIQKAKRTAPQVVHGDKLKLCHGNTPQSWLQCQGEGDGNGETGTEPSASSPLEQQPHQVGSQAILRTGEQRQQPKRPIKRRVSWTDEHGGELENLERPKRATKTPRRFENYVM